MPVEKFSDDLDYAARILKGGHLVLYPTETWYAIGAPIISNACIEKILKIKNRATNKPLPLIASDWEQANRFCDLSAVPQKLLDIFWPGPLTLVLPAKRKLHPALLDPAGRVAIRVSTAASACFLATFCDYPIISSSANLAGSTPARRSSELNRDFLARTFLFDPEAVILTNEDNDKECKFSSTIVEAIKDPKGEWSLKILREGAISVETLKGNNFKITPN